MNYSEFIVNLNSLCVVSETSCKQCDKVLQELENIDDEADSLGIDFVKIDDQQLAKEYGVFALPALLFVKKNSDPVIYAGKMIESCRETKCYQL